MKKFLMVLFLSAFLPTSSVFCEDKTEITFWHAMADPKDKVLNSIVQDFERKNQDVKVNLQYIGNYDVLLRKLLASIAAGNPPDVAQVYEDWTTKFKDKNVIIPVERFLKREQDRSQNLSDIYKIFIDNSSYGEEMWTFPFNKSIYVYFYNEDLFRKANLQPPKNMEEFLKVCSSLVRRDESGKIVQYGFAFKANIDIFAVMLYLNNGRFFNEEGTRCAFNDKAGKEALQFIVDLVNKYKVAYYSKDYLDTDFASGRMASMISTNTHRSYLQSQIKFTMGVAKLPAWKTQVSPVAGTNIAIFSKKKGDNFRDEACWRFIKFISSTENTVKWAIGTSYLPVRKSALKDKAMEDYLRKNPYELVGIEQLDSAISDPRLTVWQEARSLIGEAIEKALLQKLSAPEALDEAANKLDKLLSK